VSTNNDELHVLTYVVVVVVVVVYISLARVGDIEEGPAQWIPIKIEATQGQVTFCPENFPESSSLASPPTLGVPFCDDSASD